MYIMTALARTMSGIRPISSPPRFRIEAVPQHGPQTHPRVSHCARHLFLRERQYRRQLPVHHMAIQRHELFHTVEPEPIDVFAGQLASRYPRCAEQTLRLHARPALPALHGCHAECVYVSVIELGDGVDARDLREY